jgi:hypothetical protein
MLVGCVPAAFPQTYLGLPLTVRKLRVQDLQHLVVKIEKRTHGWKSSLLIRGSRLTLTNVVLSVLPSFAMSVIPLPSTTLDRMNRPRRSMLWKGKSTCSGGDCQVAWHDVCRSREEGGLGVRDLHCQNVSLLLKFVHKLLRGDDTPWTRWVWRHLQSTLADGQPELAHLQVCLRHVSWPHQGESRGWLDNLLWFDNWHAVGPLFARVPGLLSHCTDPVVTVAAALAHGHLVLPLHSRVTSSAQT